MKIHREGPLRAEKVMLPGGQTEVSLWYPLTAEEDDDSMGFTFDFPGEDIPHMIKLLQRLQEAAAEELGDNDWTGNNDSS